MASFKCPQCQSVIEAEPGQEAVCASCGFRAVAPGAPSAVGAARAASPPAPKVPVAISVWAYLVALAALGTFFLSSYWVPWALGLMAIALGVWAWSKDTRDRRGLAASILGGVALVMAGVYLVL